MSTPATRTAQSAADQVAELKALRSEQAAEATRAMEVEVERRAREVSMERVEARRYCTMVWLTVGTVFFAAVAAVAAVVVLLR